MARGRHWGQIHPINNWRTIEGALSGRETLADRQGRGAGSRHESAERFLIVDPRRLDEAGRYLRLNPPRIAGSKKPCGVASLEPGRSATSE